MYYFIRWKHTEEGYTPDISEDVSFLLLAEPGRACDGAEFALFRCRLLDDYESPENVPDTVSFPTGRPDGVEE
jgi:hypothetical protein